jgi:hypothetical protein
MSRGDAGAFQRHRIIVVHIVDAEHRPALRQQPFGHGHANEAGGACDEDGHGIAVPVRGGVSLSSFTDVFVRTGPRCKALSPNGPY